MPDDMYPAAEAAADETPTKTNEESDKGTSFLAPKRLIPDAKPGDTIMFYVEHIYEDEVELSVAEAEEPESEDEGEEEGEAGESEMDAAMGRMGRMAG